MQLIDLEPEFNPPPNWIKVLDQQRCIGCHACTVACKSEHDVPLGVNVLRNDAGSFTIVASGIDRTLGGRSVGVLDVDEDGLNDPTGDLALVEGTSPAVDVIVTNNTGSAATLYVIWRQSLRSRTPTIRNS